MNTGKINKIQEFSDKTQVRNVYTDGSPVRAMMKGITGKSSFYDREKIAKKIDQPINAKIPSFIQKLPMTVYRPTIRNMDGYSHFPRPLVEPYTNTFNHE